MSIENWSETLGQRKTVRFRSRASCGNISSTMRVPHDDTDRRYQRHGFSGFLIRLYKCVGHERTVFFKSRD